MDSHFNNIPDIHPNLSFEEIITIIKKLPPEIEILFQEYFVDNALSGTSENHKLTHFQHFSRQLLDKYFPCYQTLQPATYHQNPILLLSKACEAYQELKALSGFTGNLDHVFLMAALSGNLDLITNSGHPKTNTLYSICFGNRIFDFNFIVEFTEKHVRNPERTMIIMGSALNFAASEGNIEVCTYLLTTVGDYIPFKQKGLALVMAAQNGKLNTVQFLLDNLNKKYFNDYADETITLAREFGHQDVVQLIEDAILYSVSSLSDQLEAITLKRRYRNKNNTHEKGLEEEIEEEFEERHNKKKKF